MSTRRVYEKNLKTHTHLINGSIVNVRLHALHKPVFHVLQKPVGRKQQAEVRSEVIELD
jgi:hypothetical protein